MAQTQVFANKTQSFQLPVPKVKLYSGDGTRSQAQVIDTYSYGGNYIKLDKKLYEK